jgi:hypothetical protein
MAYGRDTFFNPVTLETYHWQVNHSEESQFGKTRNISNGAPTGYSGLVMQQGDDQPMTLELTGTILHERQHRNFIFWWALSASQTIYFYDFTGAGYEVVVTSYQPVRRRTLRNPRDKTIPLHYYTYTIRMQVISFLAGPIPAGVPFALPQPSASNPWYGLVGA